jgi:hypothetical protein
MTAGRYLRRVRRSNRRVVRPRVGVLLDSSDLPKYWNIYKQ